MREQLQIDRFHEDQEEVVKEDSNDDMDPMDDSDEVGVIEAESPSHMKDDLQYLHRSLQRVSTISSSVHYCFVLQLSYRTVCTYLSYRTVCTYLSYRTVCMTFICPTGQRR